MKLILISFFLVFSLNGFAKRSYPKDGTYKIQSKLDSRFCIDNHLRQPRAILWNCHEGNNQKWNFSRKKNGYYQIKSLQDDKCLDVAGRSRWNNGRVVVWNCHSGPNQEFYFDKIGSFYRIRARHSGKCIDIQNPKKRNGLSIMQYTCYNVNQHKWSLMLENRKSVDKVDYQKLEKELNLVEERLRKEFENKNLELENNLNKSIEDNLKNTNKLSTEFNKSITNIKQSLKGLDDKATKETLNRMIVDLEKTLRLLIEQAILSSARSSDLAKSIESSLKNRIEALEANPNLDSNHLNYLIDQKISNIPKPKEINTSGFLTKESLLETLGEVLFTEKFKGFNPLRDVNKDNDPSNNIDQGLRSIIHEIAIKVNSIYDGDRDGYPADRDCDDRNPKINPGAPEILDGLDNNCDGNVDRDDSSFVENTNQSSVDEDRDGYPIDRDCDDGDPNINPDAPEILDGLDNNCDGNIDRDDSNFVE